MTYHDEVVQRIYDLLRPATDEPDKWVRQQSMSVEHAIPPLILKTEDGRFVKVEPCKCAGRLGFYRIVEDPAP